MCRVYASHMFVLDPLHPIYNGIMAIVAEKPGITMADLFKALRKRKVETSLQHLYRTVARLVEGQVLLKTGKKLSVNLMWLSYVQFFAEQAKSSLTVLQADEKGFPLKEGERRTYETHTLLEVQTLWNHLLVQLYRIQPQEKYLFKFYSHAWWQVGKHALDAEFYRQIKSKGVSCYWLYGHATALDRHAMEQLEGLGDMRSAKTPPFPEEGYNLNVYGDYIFECIFPEKIAKHLGFLFHSITSFDQFDPDILADVFALGVPYKVTVWRNARQAKILRAKITQYFLKTAE
jgi:hypothetical protein